MAGYLTPGWINDASPAIDATALTNIGQGVEIAEHPYGVCSTATGTAAKTVTIDYSGTLSLFSGMEIRVKFTNANTASSPTLNVNGTGAVPIMLYGTTAAGSGAWGAGEVVPLRYDGTNWIMGASKSITSGNTTNMDGVLKGDGSNVGTMYVSNPNIVDNWYFVGGGNGWGPNDYTPSFPVRQRTGTSFQDQNTYTIDRWKIAGSNTYTTVTVQNSGLRITGTGGAANLLQYIENIDYLRERTVTLSVLTSNGLFKNSATIPATDPGSATFYATITSGSTTYARIVYQNSTWAVSLTTGSSGGTNTYYAVKLELGDTQTLAHQESGSWVINEIPSFADMMMRCARFYIRLNSLCRYPLTRYAANTKEFDFLVPLPIRMAGVPSLVGTVSVAAGVNAVSDAANYTYSVLSNGANSISIRAKAPTGSTTPTPSDGISLLISTGAALSADL